MSMHMSMLHAFTQDSTWRDIRGSAFWHTAVRENYMVADISAVLDPLGIPCANSALGMYTYAEPNMPLGDEFAPVCIVQRTLGDRRLATARNTQHVARSAQRTAHPRTYAHMATEGSALMSSPVSSSSCASS